jgi:hypothetical protein
MPKPPVEPPDSVLSREQADDVLRYWLSALRLEEALQLRPTARPNASGGAVPRLDQPNLGQDYFKVALDDALVSLLSKQTQLTRAFDAELCGFFETWLHGQYRRGSDETELSHLLCFPVVHLPQGELAGLLRCGVRLRFGSGGAKAFSAPSRAERQKSAYPAAPDEARLTRIAPPEGSWPFFLDTRLLRQSLGVPDESIDALFEALRARKLVSEAQMLALLTLMLERVASHPEAEVARLDAPIAEETTDVGPWLVRLTAVVRQLLERKGSRARAYSVGIVIDGTKAKTTWHLQREIEALIEGERGAWKLASPLGAYLTGKPLASAESPQRALFPGPTLTQSQRAAADGFWGSSLSAVQGPPGTGKTRLILHLCAEALVRQTEALLRGTGPRPELLLITSSNNRAVDNVLEPLASATGLPIALRAGSRQACERELSAQLRQALTWLETANNTPPSERSARLAQATSRFRAQRDAVESLLAPRRAELERAATRARLESELARCDTPSSAGSSAKLGKRASKATLLALEPLTQRLRALSKLCEAEATPPAVDALRVHYARTAKRQLPAAIDALEKVGLTLSLPLPPSSSPTDIDEQLEAWEDAAERGLSLLSELEAQLQQSMSVATRTAKARVLRAQLAAISPTVKSQSPPQAHEAVAQELFVAAREAREAWAAEHALELLPAVASALRGAEQDRSLRAVFREDARTLCNLFGIWGSTLLSLGNCFPSELGRVTRLVVDEAGQCHPAHAVSGLLRAQHALVIGDVHQLSPVIELGRDDEARLVRSVFRGKATPFLQPYRVHSEATSSSQALADRAVSVRGKLTDHFRCQPEIIALSDRLCDYGLTLHTPRADRSRHAPFLKRPVMFADLRGEQARWGGSWHNELERFETLELVESLLSGGIQPEEIAVITPYRGQLEHLRRGLVERRVPMEASPELAEGAGRRDRGLALGTVHRFQGGERSVVLFTSVVTLGASLPFLNAQPNLLNVAISRAQHHFICLGHGETLARGARSRLLVEGVSALSPHAYRQQGTFGDLAAHRD